MYINVVFFYIRSSNIDTRIQQAELEYQLGREELNLLSLMEETNKHKCRLDEIEQHNEQNENVTLYKCVYAIYNDCATDAWLTCIFFFYLFSLH